MNHKYEKIKTNPCPQDTMGSRIEYVGVDISLEHLDVYNAGRTKRFSNDSNGIEQIRRMLNVQDGVKRMLVYESTGWLSRQLAEELAQRNIAQVCLNPLQVRNYARARGIHAKTDILDSQIIAMYAQSMQMKENVEVNRNIMKLKELESGREFFVRRLAQARTARAGLKDEMLLKLNEEAQQEDERHVKEIEEQMKQIVMGDEEKRELYEFLQTLPGIGEKVSMALISQLPELGNMNKKQAAALVGVAPYNWESGKMRGKRRTRYGRRHIRNMLYLAVISTLRLKGSPIKDFYERLKGEGKASKVAIIACVRKMVIWLNSETRKWRERREGAISSERRK